MINILIYAIASIGFAYIVGQSEISFSIRMWLSTRVPWFVRLIECPVCFGTWVGFFFGWWLNPLSLNMHPISIEIVTAAFTAGSNLLLARLAGIYVPGTKETP